MKREQSNSISICSSGYHFEPQSDFKNSVYKNVYKEAYLRVEDIIRNAGEQNNVNRRISAALQADFPNIITFIGTRGVGKTSVMLSFLEALKDYCPDEDRNNTFYTFKGLGNILFTCLNCIDGSLMEHGEDIFKTILAQMYQKFIDLEKGGDIHKGADFDFRKRELMRELEDVYRTVCEIETMEKNQIMAGEAYMSSLQSFSSSQKVRKDFVKLIGNFTDLMRYNRFGRTIQSDAHYVVIAIDDIDLNIQNSFSMLEKIHRYCTVPNVIVLLTLDVQQILSIVTKHFYEVAPKVNKLLIAQEQYVRNLSMDYLEKVLPVNYRIYMPGVNKKVVIQKEKTDVKKSILGKLYRRTGICFDSQGLKRHFYVPSSMRELTGFYLMLESMGKLNKAHLTDASPFSGQTLDNEKIEEIKNTVEENYSILLADLENRLVLEKVYKREDIDFFRNLVRADIRRAMTSVKEYYHICKIRLNGRKVEFEPDYMPDDADDTSYGDLIKTIYSLGRLQNGLYKPMVHCLIAYFSLALSREYIYEKILYADQEQGNGQNSEKGMMENIIGGHVVTADWARSLIPQIKVMQEGIQGTGESSGGKSQADTSKDDVGRVDTVRLDKILTIQVPEKVLNDAFQKKEYDDLIHILGQMEIMSLFFTNFVGTPENQRAWKFAIDKAKNGKKTLVYNNAWGEGVWSARADFDVLNVIINSMYATEKLEKVEEALMEAVENYASEEIKNLGENEKQSALQEIKNELGKYSLKKKYQAWEEKHGGPTMPLPLWWFDFSYNILKRAVREQKKKNPRAINKAVNMYDYMKDLYVGIGKQLKQQQEFYITDRVEEADEIRIVDLFSECPVIEVFLDEKGQESEETDDEKQRERVQGEEKMVDLRSDLVTAVNQLFSRLKNFRNE